jgi:hypothetical protein
MMPASKTILQKATIFEDDEQWELQKQECNQQLNVRILIGRTSSRMSR